MNCYFYTFGCKVNTCETAGMQSLLQSAGYTVVSQPEEADIFLFNSCTVTASGDSRLRHAMRKVRREHPDALLVLTGCYPQAYPDRQPPSRSRPGLAQTPEQAAGTAGGAVSEPCPIAAVDSYARGLRGAALRHHAGQHPCLSEDTGRCNCFCSYCIPYARGRCRSLPPEAGPPPFAENGYREIVLCGINLGFTAWSGTARWQRRWRPVPLFPAWSVSGWGPSNRRLTEEQLSRWRRCPSSVPSSTCLSKAAVTGLCVP
ncbi:MAG: hypothetical protein ACLR5S_09745 [Ruminococcus sp.]